MKLTKTLREHRNSKSLITEEKESQRTPDELHKEEGRNLRLPQNFSKTVQVHLDNKRTSLCKMRSRTRF